MGQRYVDPRHVNVSLTCTGCRIRCDGGPQESRPTDHRSTRRPRDRRRTDEPGSTLPGAYEKRQRNWRPPKSRRPARPAPPGMRSARATGSPNKGPSSASGLPATRPRPIPKCPKRTSPARRHNPPSPPTQPSSNPGVGASHDRGQKRANTTETGLDHGTGTQGLRLASRTDHPDITGTVGHGTSWLRCRAAVTRPVIADQPQPAAFGIGQRARAIQTAASGRAHVHHHRPAARIPGIFDSQRPAIWCRHEPLHSRALRAQSESPGLMIVRNSSRARSQNRSTSATAGSSPEASIRAWSCSDRRPP